MQHIVFGVLMLIAAIVGGCTPVNQQAKWLDLAMTGESFDNQDKLQQANVK